MDKRSWLWKKKTSDKNTDVCESSPSRALRPYGDQCQADEKIRLLNERLLAADDLAKQHATVAEEAVSGWEKAKSEYMSVKYQLDTVLEQKQAAEVRVFHLDGALKECMQQLRQVREEQEQRIHEAIMKRNRDWDKIRLDLEERLANADQELIEAGNQKKILYKTVQEQAETIAELGQIRSQAEAEIKMLQVQIQNLEKGNTSLKYEIVILNKELDIRTQEREINNRSFDMANQQHIEGTKRIAKLEAECQRLRVLVRKKLPGPGALLQMKLEAGVDAEKGDHYNKRRPGGRAATSPKALHTDSTALSEKLLALEEETEMLKEALARRNKELQTARLLCANTTDKISSLEGQVGQFQKSPRVPFIGPRFHGAECFLSKEPSLISMSEDGNDDERSVADSWTSGLITEFPYFQKDKSTQQQSNIVHSPKLLERLNSIDDFMEIERLVSLPSEKPGVEPNINVELSQSSISNQVLAKDAELQAANRLCAEVNKKLAIGEEQLSMLRTKNMANELNLFSLQQKLITILEAPERGDPEMVLEKLKNAVLASRCSSVDGLQSHVRKLCGVAAPDHNSTGSLCSLESSHFQESSQGKCFREDKIGPELTSVVCKVVHVVEDLASESMAQHATSSLKEGHLVNSENGHHNTPKSRPSELEAIVRNFNVVSNQYLYGKAELVQFIEELCSVLSQLKNMNSSKAYGSLSSRIKWRPEAVQVAEQDVFSDVGSPVSLTSNSDGSAKAFHADDRLASSKRASLDEDLRKVRAEKAALESHLRAELSKMTTMEHMLAELKQKKVELEKKLEEERDKFETMKVQLLDSEQLVATLRARLASVEFSGTIAEKSLSSNSAVKAKLETQLEDSRFELTHTHEKLKNLERVINQEQRKNEELQKKVDELEALRQRSSSSGFQGDAERSSKEQEIADATEKLAECQRTIFVLGRQLKDIVSAQDVGSIPAKLPTHQFQQDAPNDKLTEHSNTMSTLQKVKQRVPTSDPGVCSISDVTNDELNSFAEDPGPGLEKPVSDLLVDKVSLYRDDVQGKISSLQADADKQLVKYVPKPASRKKTTLHRFIGIDMSKSLNLDPSASPRKHGNGFSKYFTRNKNPS